jgi:hypothetical protein
MGDDELSRRRNKKKPKSERIDNAIKAVRSCGLPLKSGGKCTKPRGHMFGKGNHK